MRPFWIRVLFLALPMVACREVAAVDDDIRRLASEVADLARDVQGKCMIDRDSDSVGEFPNLWDLKDLLSKGRIAVSASLSESIQGKASEYGVESANCFLAVAVPVAEGNPVWGRTESLALAKPERRRLTQGVIDLAERWTDVVVVDVPKRRVWCCGGGGSKMLYELTGLAEHVTFKDAGFSASYILGSMERTLEVLRWTNTTIVDTHELARPPTPDGR